MKYSCLVADDEKLARELIKDYLAQVDQLELKAECKDGVEVIKALQDQKIDILFLDIQMPHLKGTEVVKSVGDKLPAVIFTTAYDQYAVQAFDLQAVDYLLKPFGFERFLAAVNKAIEKLSSAQKVDSSIKSEYMMVKSDYKLVKVKFEDIIYIESLREYIRIHTTNDKIVTLDTMKNMEELLPAHLFIRIHKSFIVAFDKIKALHGNQIDIDDNTVIPIGRSYKNGLMERFSD
ncbi:MAG: LytTR family DNA-binding domain-containing protein [Chitinophagales bacterium]